MWWSARIVVPELGDGWCGMETGIAGADGGPVVVSIVDDHPDLCYGVLARLPQANSSFAAGVMAATVAEFLARDSEAARRSDVVLLDLTLKDESSPAGNVARLKDARSEERRVGKECRRRWSV